jgi:hypothetical protein
MGAETESAIWDTHYSLRPIITYTAMVWWPRVNTKPKVSTSQTVAIEDGSYNGT